MSWKNMSRWQRIKAVLRGEVQTIGLKEGAEIYKATTVAFGDTINSKMLSMIPFITIQVTTAMGGVVTVAQEAKQKAAELATLVKTANSTHDNFKTTTASVVRELHQQITKHNDAVENSKVNTKNEVQDLETEKTGVEAVAGFFTTSMADNTQDSAEPS